MKQQENNKQQTMGVGGATTGFWIGRFIGEIIHATTATIVASPSLIGGPLTFGVAVTATYATMAPAMEGLKQITSLSGGLVGGVATGPV